MSGMDVEVDVVRDEEREEERIVFVVVVVVVVQEEEEESGAKHGARQSEQRFVCERGEREEEEGELRREVWGGVGESESGVA